MLELSSAAARAGSLELSPADSHRHDQPIAAPPDRFDVLGLVGRVTQRLPQLLDGSVDAVVELYDRVVGPQPLLDLVERHDVAATLDQHQQDLEGLFLEERPCVLPCAVLRP